MYPSSLVTIFVSSISFVKLKVSLWLTELVALHAFPWLGFLAFLHFMLLLC
ncbi:hypothetical protein LINPERHAP1_LOCUS25887 [Linum perenne]